ncbi:MAG: hypothetical protein AAF802_10720 [Planctomycetota bacterium]
MHSIHNALFDQIPAVRYVAVLDKDELSLHQRHGVSDASSNESDRYEELFVNPAILLLASNRGKVDCGGMEYAVIRYGNFFQFIRATETGHISIAIEPNANLDQTIDQVLAVLP